MAEGVRLTKRAVDNLQVADEARIFYDSEVKGFGPRLTPAGVKTFIVEYRRGGRGRGVAKCRFKLGTYGEITPDPARFTAKGTGAVPHGTSVRGGGGYAAKLR